MTDFERTQNFLSEQRFMTIAVVLDDGTPWATPVKIQAQGKDYFEWDSRTDTEHSRAIERNPRIAISMFETKLDGHLGYYAQARVDHVKPVDAERSRYRASVIKAWINDQTFVKRELTRDA